MKLFLLSQEDRTGWDTYDSCVVCAENEEDAKNIMPNGEAFRPSGRFGNWAFSLDGVKCEEIGETIKDIGRGVICASFNAG